MISQNSPILLVEDNPVDLDLTLRAFKTCNPSPEIQIARDGEEALEYISRWEKGESLPAVILLDLKLPKVDGLEVLEKIKSHPEYRMIPIVILTSSADSSDIRTAYQFGANSYIVKPVDFDKFISVALSIEAYWKELNMI